jgi:hypothetical protein
MMTAFSTSQYRNRAVPLGKVERLRRLAWLIDAAGRLPGTRFRFGLNSVIGLAPGAGDAVLSLISLYIVYEAAQLGLPRAKIIRMLRNVAVEAALGTLPLVGDLLDVVWKANLRNIAIIDEHFGQAPDRAVDLCSPRDSTDTGQHRATGQPVNREWNTAYPVNITPRPEERAPFRRGVASRPGSGSH